MSGMYSAFEVDNSKQDGGIWLDYGSFQVKVAYAGITNKAFSKMGEKKLRPLRRAIEAGTIDDTRQLHAIMELYSEVIILDWQTLDPNREEDNNDQMIRGIESKDRSVLPFSTENVLKTFKALPTLFMDIKSQADSLEHFRIADLEDDAGN